MGATLTATAALDRYFLETRCKILEIAASLDRIDRGENRSTAHNDARMNQIRQSLQLLLDGHADRAERCQSVFSLPYDASWQVPNRGRTA